MFGLARGVSRIESILPDPVYALLSGLNSATVGLIALAGLQLSTRTITDGLSRTVLIGTACAGLLYTALWYFPVLMIISALLAIVWDLWAKKEVSRLHRHFDDSRKKRRVVPPPPQPSEEGASAESPRENIGMTDKKQADEAVTVPNSPPAPPLSVTTKQGIAIILTFFVIFITLMVLRSTVKDPPVDLRLFTNLFLAGTIIFGGGPVVVPLLRDYVVEEGWVSSRDFLIGLAIIQAFPGPNFNCEWFSSEVKTTYSFNLQLPSTWLHSPLLTLHPHQPSWVSWASLASSAQGLSWPRGSNLSGSVFGHGAQSILHFEVSTLLQWV